MFCMIDRKSFSIYGTQGFAGFKLSVLERQKVRDFIGPRAERLVRTILVLYNCR